jgi:hypothetical protein
MNPLDNDLQVKGAVKLMHMYYFLPKVLSRASSPVHMCYNESHLFVTEKKSILLNALTISLKAGQLMLCHELDSNG